MLYGQSIGNCVNVVKRTFSSMADRRQKNFSGAIRRGELVLFYQPKVDMSTGEAIGVEALLRWKHPKLGLLSPAMFIQAMHVDYDGVINIGRWAIQQAVRQISEWAKMGLSLPISVNVLASELADDNFCAWLHGVFSKNPDVNPSMLELEVVESSSIGDIQTIMQVFKACQEMGVKVALDDFGTGYSSLSHIRNLNADHVKIDQSFVKNLHLNHQDRGLVRIVIQLAYNFDCKVIAEGVESVNHGLILMRMGCRYAQGYVIAKPMPASEMQRWISQYQGFPEWAGDPL